MNLEKVEDLLQDIFSVPDTSVGSAKEWLETTNLFAAAIAHADDLLVIQIESERYGRCQPYLQICYEDDRAMAIEAVSNRFLQPPLSVDAKNTMIELGWELSEAKGLPNYFKFLNKEDAEPSVVAQIFTKTLRDVYGIVPSDTIGIMERDGIWPVGPVGREKA